LQNAPNARRVALHFILLRTLEFDVDGFMNELIIVDLTSHYFEVVGFFKLPAAHMLTILDGARWAAGAPIEQIGFVS
jgi:hypothetical protein